MDQFASFALTLALDFAAFLLIPPLTCSAGIFAERYVSLGFGGELMAILSTVLLSVAIYTWAMDAVFELVEEPRSRWSIWVVLMALNFVYIFWIAIACIKSSTVSPPPFITGFGSTVFGCHFTSLAFHLLKFFSYYLCGNSCQVPPSSFSSSVHTFNLMSTS